MRLIDADKLKDESVFIEDVDWSIDAVPVEAIDNATTVDAVPVVHAHWEVCEDESGTYGICSHCGCDTPFWTGEPVEYCCRCGARMDKVDNQKSNLDKDGDNNETN